MKNFNDAVLYIRDGKAIPGIVLKSQQTTAGELLTILYADPDTGPSLVAQGTCRGIGSIASAVGPMGTGRMFGWKDTAEMQFATENAGLRAQLAELKAEAATKPVDDVQGKVPPGDPKSPAAIPVPAAKPEPAPEAKK